MAWLLGEMAKACRVWGRREESEWAQVGEGQIYMREGELMDGRADCGIEVGND